MTIKLPKNEELRFTLQITGQSLNYKLNQNDEQAIFAYKELIDRQINNVYTVLLKQKMLSWFTEFNETFNAEELVDFFKIEETGGEVAYQTLRTLNQVSELDLKNLNGVLLNGNVKDYLIYLNDIYTKGIVEPLLIGNIGLIVKETRKVVKNMINGYHLFHDYLTEAEIGFMQALQRFNFKMTYDSKQANKEMRFKFSTILTNWVKQALFYYSNQDNLIVTPLGLKTFRKEENAESLRIKPTDDTKTIEKKQNLSQYLQYKNIISLSKELDNGKELDDFIVPTETTPETEIHDSELQQSIIDMLTQHLTDIELLIFAYRYGISYYNKLSGTIINPHELVMGNTEIANRLNIPLKDVTAIKNRAANKLKNANWKEIVGALQAYGNQTGFEKWYFNRDLKKFFPLKSDTNADFYMIFDKNGEISDARMLYTSFDPYDLHDWLMKLPHFKALTQNKQTLKIVEYHKTGLPSLNVKSLSKLELQKYEQQFVEKLRGVV